MASLRDQVLRNLPFLFLRHHDGNMFVCDAPNVKSQYLRRELVRQLKLGEIWDWKVYPGIKYILSIIDLFKRQENPKNYNSINIQESKMFLPENIGKSFSISQSPLHYLLDKYSKTFLTRQSQERIRTRELSGLFPFSICNIYRVLMGISKTFYESFELLNEKINLKSIKSQELLGLPYRVFRYFHVVLFGAFFTDKNDYTNRISLLHSIAQPIVQRIIMQYTIPESEITVSEYYLAQHLENKKMLLLWLYIYVNSLTIYLWDIMIMELPFILQSKLKKAFLY
ncbi:MAG: hypothetical protein OMM_01951 [Candidatus Magnetoglobus multicellularis str. Araruama]|uniref:Uncharacterized protein n=1 Tax=Candidatus Magnetoglobus multicellularis str. Araruama TaxID=890399 RepID=A0A1V1PBF9_9BACT|nr:MAG: hypothetical protein OMM_01951 [Candidatus Magnetoglobus multicellularis str. Araruama]